MRTRIKVTLGIVAAGALFVSGASLASAADRTPPSKPPVVPKSVIADAKAHIDSLGPSTNLPAKSEGRQVTVTPCTLFNGKLLHGHSRAIKTRGSGSLSSQGGASAGCHIPEAATALTVVITTPAVKASGKINWQATGSSKAVRVASYTKKQAMTTTAYLGLGKLDPAGKFSNAGTTLTASIVVVGYAIPPIAGMIAPDGSVYAGTSRILSAAHNSAGNYTVTVDADVTYCTPTVTGYSGYIYATAYTFSTNKVQVYIWYLTGGAETAYNTYFYLNVEC